jgi:acyl carrier protein
MLASTQDIAQTVIGFVAASKSLDPQTITPATTFDDLQMDSLDKINLSFEVEERFRISIPDDALNSLRTIADVVTGVEKLQAEQAAA